MTENPEDYEDWDEEEGWSPEWYPLPEDLLKKKKVKETEEIVVATFGSTPWSADKPPRPDRPKKKEKVIISEYVKKSPRTLLNSGAPKKEIPQGNYRRGRFALDRARLRDA